MAVIGAILVLLALGVSLWAAVCFAAPHRVKLSGRGQAVKLWAVSVAMLVLGSIIMPEPPPPTEAELAERRAAAEAREDARAERAAERAATEAAREAEEAAAREAAAAAAARERAKAAETEALKEAGAIPFQTLISRALGTSNRDVQRVSVAQLQGERLVVQWAINDNLTSGMVSRGARLDIHNMLEVIADGQEPYTSVFLRGTFSLVDRLGNASEANVVEATFTKSTIDRINFENFLTDNVYVVAEDTDIHPEFR